MSESQVCPVCFTELSSIQNLNPFLRPKNGLTACPFLPGWVEMDTQSPSWELKNESMAKIHMLEIELAQGMQAPAGHSLSTGHDLLTGVQWPSHGSSEASVATHRGIIWTQASSAGRDGSTACAITTPPCYWGGPELGALGLQKRQGIGIVLCSPKRGASIVLLQMIHWKVVSSFFTSHILLVFS